MTSTTVPLRSLLDAPRGRCITSLEAKAVLYRMADDLATLHSERIVHRRVSLDAAQLTLVEGYAAVALPSGNAAIRLPIGTGSYIAPREANVDAAHLPPEAAGCHQDRTVHTCQGDMWAFGVAAFQLLTNGALPFDVIDLAVLGGTVDDMQNWIDDNLKLALCAYLPAEPGRRHHECVGIDNHAATMLAGLLRADPAQRLTAIDVLQHPWLSDVVDLLPKAAVFAAMQVVAATPLRTNTTTATKTHSSHGVAASSFTENSVAPVPIANDGGQPRCPYPLIGHVARPVQVRDSLSGEVHTMSALHAVYEVPGNGPMMSANPVKMVPLETVACLVAGQHAEASLVNGAQGRCTALA
jgi:serine/threonine protein kinase